MKTFEGEGRLMKTDEAIEGEGRPLKTGEGK